MEVILEFFIRGLLFEYTGMFARKLWCWIIGGFEIPKKKGKDEEKMQSFLDKLLGFIILTVIVVVVVKVL